MVLKVYYCLLSLFVFIVSKQQPKQSLAKTLVPVAVTDGNPMQQKRCRTKNAATSTGRLHLFGTCLEEPSSKWWCYRNLFSKAANCNTIQVWKLLISSSLLGTKLSEAPGWTGRDKEYKSTWMQILNSFVITPPVSTAFIERLPCCGYLR